MANANETLSLVLDTLLRVINHEKVEKAIHLVGIATCVLFGFKVGRIEYDGVVDDPRRPIILDDVRYHTANEVF
jgi:hypothetical protein